jgi:peptidoglycan/xylan/chitin deacetylase (PgdA/CDA1 family)
MQPLSVVIATARSGDSLEALLQGAGDISRDTGIGFVIVARESTPGVADVRADPSEVQLVAAPGARTDGAALIAGVAHAQARRCLLLVALPDEELVRAHHDAPADAATVAALSVPHSAVERGRERDPLYAFAVRRGRGACVPREPLLELANGGELDRTVPAYELARRLRARGVAFLAVPVPGARDGSCEDDPHALGRAAAVLYRSVPPTLRESGLASFRDASLARIMLRRTAAPAPALARAVRALGGSASATGLRARLRELASDALFWSGARGAVDRDTWRRIKGGVTILMYHAFAAQDGDASRYVMPARKLERQLNALRFLRRRVISLETYAALREANALPPPGAVVITIDDGYQDVYDIAAPIIASRGYHATVFAVSNCVGQHAEWAGAGSLRGRPLASWQALRDGLAAGLAVGAHSRTHPSLTELSDEAMSIEIEGSRVELAAQLGRPVTTFAYPHGDEDVRTQAILARAGFALACTSKGGKNRPCEPALRLRRVEVRGDQGLMRFILAVMLGRRTIAAGDSLERGRG